MKTFRPMMIALVCLAACAAKQTDANVPGAVAECEVKEDANEKVACYRERARIFGDALLKQGEKDKKAKPTATAEPAAPPPSAPPVMVVPVRRIALPAAGNPRLGCDRTYNFAVENATEEYVEVTSPALLPCGNGGSLVDLWIQQGNGGKRLAKVIPPGGVGIYYFDKDVGGHGPQDYRVVGYGASPLNGSEQFPVLASGRTYVNRARTPFEGNFEVVTIHRADLRVRI